MVLFSQMSWAYVLNYVTFMIFNFTIIFLSILFEGSRQKCPSSFLINPVFQVRISLYKLLKTFILLKNWKSRKYLLNTIPQKPWPHLTFICNFTHSTKSCSASKALAKQTKKNRKSEFKANMIIQYTKKLNGC